tara:strand:+ start:940 stop:1329 length:390 start_codon:yes stop_codon:yes gene_type:complete
MSDLKYCQGVKCHTYQTKDRIRGTKGKKYYQTRRRSSFYYLGGNACSMQCERDWYDRYGEQAINHFGRIVEPTKLTEENAWYKFKDWRSDEDRYYFANQLSNQRIQITEEEYRNNNLIRPTNQTNNLSQ